MNDKISCLLGNLGIILGLVFLVFIVLDWYNAYMNFVGNMISMKLLILLCITSIVNGIRIQTKNKKE